MVGGLLPKPSSPASRVHGNSSRRRYDQSLNCMSHEISDIKGIVPPISVQHKAEKCAYIARTLFPDDEQFIVEYSSRLMKKSDEEIDKLYAKYQFPALVGDTVEWCAPDNKLLAGQCLTRQDNLILLQIDKKYQRGFSHQSDGWAAKSLQPDPDKNVVWIHEKQIKKVTRGTLEDRFEILERMLFRPSDHDDPVWHDKFQTVMVRASQSQNFEELRNITQAYLTEKEWPQEIIDTILSVTDDELSMVFQEAEALENSLNSIEKELTKASLTLPSPDSTVSTEIESKEKSGPTTNELYEDKSTTYHKTENNSLQSASKEKRMSDKPSFMEMVKGDGTDAAYRVGAKQMTKAVKVAASNMLKSRGMKKSQINAIGEFMETEFGEALISMALGTGLNYVPGISADPRAQKLAKEFRVEGMATAGNLVTTAAMDYLLPAMAGVIQQLPEEGTKTRVSEPTKELAEMEEIAEEEAVEAAKPAKARA